MGQRNYSLDNERSWYVAAADQPAVSENPGSLVYPVPVYFQSHLRSIRQKTVIGYSPRRLFSALVPISFILPESSSPSEVSPESAEDLAPSPPSSTCSPSHLPPGVPAVDYWNIRFADALPTLLPRRQIFLRARQDGQDTPEKSAQSKFHPVRQTPEVPLSFSVVSTLVLPLWNVATAVARIR